MKIGALAIGVFIVLLGAIGLAAPHMFFVIIGWFQVPPTIYVAAVIRFAVGLVLVFAAPKSRMGTILMVLGVLVALGGALTPFIGERGARVILNWWSAGGPMVVRMWGAATVAIGILIVYAVAPTRRAV